MLPSAAARVQAQECEFEALRLAKDTVSDDEWLEKGRREGCYHPDGKGMDAVSEEFALLKIPSVMING